MVVKITVLPMQCPHNCYSHRKSELVFQTIRHVIILLSMPNAENFINMYLPGSALNDGEIKALNIVKFENMFKCVGLLQ